MSTTTLFNKNSRKVLPLHKQVPKRRDKYEICAFDMETRGLGGEFIVCGFLCSNNTRYVAHSLADCLTFIIEHPHYRYLAHNASGYEFAYLYPLLYEHFLGSNEIEIKPTIQGDSRIVQFEIKKNGKKWIDIRDTLCLFNESLAKVAAHFCPDLPKGEPPWDKAHDNFDPTSKLWMDYLWRDCEIVMVAYRKHADNIWNTFHTNLGVTAGSTAIRCFVTTINDGYVYYPLHPTTEEFIRQAYYGAAVFPGHEIGDWGEVTSVDINGAYGYQMGTNQFPVGTPIHTYSYRGDNTLGIYRVIVHVPKHLYKSLGFNPIPHRTKSGLVWESGTFETSVTNIEIAYATKKGCTFTILEGFVWYRSEYVFKDFIEKCQQLELDPNLKQSTKLTRNTAYGKFGTKREHVIIEFHHKTPLNKDLIPYTNEKTGKFIDGLYIGKEPTNAPYILPHWATFITAYQRVYLFGFIEETYRRGATNVYCDTDSIKSSSKIVSTMISDGFIPIGKEYGKFKVEEVSKEFILIGPKTFYSTSKEGDYTVAKAKGIPNRELNRDIYINALKGKRNDIPFLSVNGVKNLIKGQTVLPVQRKRKITDIKNSNAWEVNKGEIFPYGYLRL